MRPHLEVLAGVEARWAGGAGLCGPGLVLVLGLVEAGGQGRSAVLRCLALVQVLLLLDQL